MNSQEHKILERYSYSEHPRMLFFLFCFSFFIGIIWGSNGIQIQEDIIIVIGPLILVLLLWIRNLVWIILILTWTILGYIHAWNHYNSRIESIHHMEWILDSKKQNIVWTIEKELYKNEFNQAYSLYIDNFDNTSTWRIDKNNDWSRILLEVPENLKLKKWDTIKVQWKIQKIYEWKIDWFEKYTLLHGLTAKITVSHFIVLESAESSKLMNISQWTEKQIFKWFPREVAWVVLGMTIWNVELMSRELQEKFRVSWISHILVVSWSNITFLIVLISGIIKYLPITRLFRISLISVFVLFYSTLVWWDVPVLRSTIMWLIWFYIIENWSRISSLAILCLTALWFIVYSPLSLVYDPAFWLSYTATMSIILYHNKILSLASKYHFPSIIWGIFAITISASIWTLPITLYHFWVLSFWFIFANIAISMAVGWILLFSVGYICMTLFGTGLLYIFWLLVYYPVEYIILIAEYFWWWWTMEVPANISLLILVVSFWIFTMEFFEEERINSVKVKKTYDPQY